MPRKSTEKTRGLGFFGGDSGKDVVLVWIFYSELTAGWAFSVVDACHPNVACVMVPGPLKIVSLCLAGSMMVPATAAHAQVITVLYSFKGGSADGQNPAGALSLVGSNLWGTTAVGGLVATGSEGTIFRIATDGTCYEIAHSFLGLPNDGANPNGSLTLYQSAFYGLTSGGGSANGGTVFKIGTDDNGYSVTHQFQGSPADGTGAYGSLAQANGAFYGVTQTGGANNLGTIFKQNADGTGYAVLYSFTGTASGDGRHPLYTTLAASGNTLYGMTFGGGAAGFGTVFKINTDGTGYAVIHSFAGDAADGRTPFGSLTIVGGVLYGMTDGGGTAGQGTVFRLNGDGTGFHVLHSFAGGPSDGANPQGDLLLSPSGRLYGETGLGGSAALGTLFGIDPDGSDYQMMHSFLGGPDDGAGPMGAPIIYGSALYGTATEVGTANDGVIWSFPVPEPSPLLLTAAAALALAANWRRWRWRLLRRGDIARGQNRPG
jgi:uncharacterized repeat protein (TIGR03803 family)